MLSWQRQLLTEVDSKSVLNNFGRKFPDRFKLFEEKIKRMPPSVLKTFLDYMTKGDISEKFEAVNALLDIFKNPLEVEGTKVAPPKYKKEWVEIAKLQPTKIGPGELYIYLSTKGCNFAGGQDYDLIMDEPVEGDKRWEVKDIVGNGKGNFDLATKGKITRFPEISTFYKSTQILDEVLELIKSSNVEEELKNSYPELLNILIRYSKPITSKFTFKQGLMAGEVSKKLEDFYSELRGKIMSALDSVEKGQRNFTNITLGGKAVKSKYSKINPINPEDVQKGIVTIDFLDDETKQVLELLTNLPEFQEGADLPKALDTVSNQIKESLVNFYFITNNTNNIVIVKKSNLFTDIARSPISRAGMQMQLSKERLEKYDKENQQ